ncbi:MAG: ABC transporter permease [Halothiobacillaceae bacterium]|nr:ABC transporter permease [Halothiobacillaceae bacterium]
MKRLINQTPAAPWRLALGLLPFVLVLLVYLSASANRLAENPDDPLLPSIAAMADTIADVATEPNRRTGELTLWVDTAASLTRLALGVGIAMAIGLVVGVLTGLIPYANRTFSPFVSVLSMIPPLAVLPILFIALGVGEVAKVALIVFGIAPFIMRDIQQRVEELPRELLVKAQTLGANTWQIILRLVLPQVMPRLLDATRLALGSAWLFLIASEAIAATEGLGYRIFLVRRYLDMELILPYVMWITLLAFLADVILRLIVRIVFPWYRARRS